MEYAIPITHTEKVLRELRDIIRKNNFKVHLPIEIRFAPKNDAWMSMAYGQIVCYIGIICYQPFGKKIAHEDYFKATHQLFSKYEGRPHWAKKHYYTPQKLLEKYPKWNDFKHIKTMLDPNKMFENEFLKTYFS